MPTLALSMIVKNAEASLDRCLESVRGLADEIVIADTGSTDSTQEIAHKHGAKWFSIPWEMDFAKARNLSLAEVKSDWVLLLDADEMLDPKSVETARRLITHSEVAAYITTVRNFVLTLNYRIWDWQAVPNDSDLPDGKQYPAYIDHENVRLFRRDPDVYFVGCVHETVAPRIYALKRKLVRSNVVLYHFGMAVNDEGRKPKQHFYRELGEAKLKRMPNDPQAHFELGIEELDSFNNVEKALACFERARQLGPDFRLAWFFNGVALARLGRDQEALRCYDRAAQLAPETAVLAEARGDAYYNAGDFEAARRAYRRAVEHSRDSALMDSKMGLTELKLGRAAKGVALLRRAIEREPRASELYERLMGAYVSLGRMREAAEMAEIRLEKFGPSEDSFLHAAILRAKLEEWPRTRTLLRAGLERFPQSARMRAIEAEVESLAERAQCA